MLGRGKAAVEVAGEFPHVLGFPRTVAARQGAEAHVALWRLAAVLALEAGVFVSALASGKIPPVVLSLFRALLTI